jgi:hypothetical protein
VIYTGVFQDKDGRYHFETHVATHDRRAAWHEVHAKRSYENTCLTMLIDGQVNVRTYEDVVDINEQ